MVGFIYGTSAVRRTPRYERVNLFSRPEVRSGGTFSQKISPALAADARLRPFRLAVKESYSIHEIYMEMRGSDDLASTSVFSSR